MVKRKRGRPLGSIGARDRLGHLIPRAGTRSRMIYEMIGQDIEPYVIARVLSMSKCNVHQVIFRIRHPDQTKDQHRIYMANRRGTANVTP